MRLKFIFIKPKPRKLTAPNFRVVSGRWIVNTPRTQSYFENENFLFLGERHSLKDVGWDGNQVSKLWRYNQHYFDDLLSVNANEREFLHIALMTLWIKQNPPYESVGWEPYPTSLRIVNWIKWSFNGKILSAECQQSLANQIRWLTQRMEWHLLGNHLFANAKALVFAGVAFEGDEATDWLNEGLRIIERELPEQVLPDGGNFELSPMYHSIFLSDMLDLINLAESYPELIKYEITKQWRETANRMILWLKGMTHPDGEISLFNDAAFGIALSPSQLNTYARQLKLLNSVDEEKLSTNCYVDKWSDTGYVRLSTKHAVVLLDVAKIGPDYLPSHSNADTLSFEFSLFGQRMIVNGGTSCYGTGQQRVKERQTQSHSTVEINGESSSEVWSGFRVAKRAYPFDLIIEDLGKEVKVACSHDGYKRLQGIPIHRRSWTLSPQSLEVIDLINGKYESAKARYIFHPDVKIYQQSSKIWEVILKNHIAISIEIVSGIARLDNANYAARFGESQPTQCLAIDFENGISCLRIKWMCP